MAESGVAFRENVIEMFAGLAGLADRIERDADALIRKPVRPRVVVAAVVMGRHERHAEADMVGREFIVDAHDNRPADRIRLRLVHEYPVGGTDRAIEWLRIGRPVAITPHLGRRQLTVKSNRGLFLLELVKFHVGADVAKFVREERPDLGRRESRAVRKLARWIRVVIRQEVCCGLLRDRRHRQGIDERREGRGRAGGRGPEEDQEACSQQPWMGPTRQTLRRR